MTKANKFADSTDISQSILKHWHEAVPNDRLAHLVKDAGRAFMRSLQPRLAKHDVSLGHWSFLRILWEEDGITQRELSVRAGVMEPTTLIAIRSMEAQGYVTREHLDGNRKNIHIFLTPQGRKLKKKLVPLAEEVNAIAIDGLSAAAIVEARQTLLRIVSNLLQDKVASSADMPRASEATAPKPAAAARKTAAPRRKPKAS